MRDEVVEGDANGDKHENEENDNDKSSRVVTLSWSGAKCQSELVRSRQIILAPI